jgi:serine-type D-Ala-D-Ala carboxypeptidase (penicillin-binding protein 5/6)
MYKRLIGMKRLAWLLCFSLWSGWLGATVLPPAPEVAAKAYLLIDVSTGQVLAQRDADAPVEPASLTKLMSAYVVFDALRAGQLQLSQTVTVSERAWRAEGSRMFLEPGWQVPVEDLLKGMIVQSGNDATVALAEAVGGTVEQFVVMMNQQAQALGLKHTQFKNPDGLTEAGHTTTARDLATLATRLMHDFPKFVGYYAIQRYRYPNTPKANDTNRNLLLFRDPSVDGLKTGHTEAAGYCLIATAQRPSPVLAPDGKRRLLSVVLGASSAIARANESQKLLNWGYTAYRLTRLSTPEQALVQPKIWKGQSDTAQLGVAGGLVVATPAGQAQALRTQVTHAQPMMAPLAKGQVVGEVQVRLGDDGPVLLQRPLQALGDVTDAGMFRRAWHGLLLSLE